MKIHQAKAIARDWVVKNMERAPAFHGAWFAGSINALPNDATLPETSDLDVMVVLAASDPPVKPGKFREQDVLLEITYLALDQVLIPEQVLGHYHLGESMRSGEIIADPTGHLAVLQKSVQDRFCERFWIRQRTAQARDTVLARVDVIAEMERFEEQLMSWLFAVGGVPHVLLVAGLRNPTVRKRYVAARSLLMERGQTSLYDQMLGLLDPYRMTEERVLHYLAVVGEAFDVASTVVSTPAPFASDLAADARPISIDGSIQLIEQGNSREAIFWIAVTFARCQVVLHAGATETVAHRLDDAFRDFATELGVGSFEDLQRRGDAIRHFLPRVWDEGSGIIPDGAILRRFVLT